MFDRWDDEKSGERFNIDASNLGLSTHPDEYYRTGYFEMLPEIEREGCFLQSMTPRMELFASGIICIPLGTHYMVMWRVALYNRSMRHRRRYLIQGIAFQILGCYLCIIALEG